jgi:hypothetical protein
VRKAGYNMSAEKESTSFFGLLNMRLGVSLSVFGSMLATRFIQNRLPFFFGKVIDLNDRSNDVCQGTARRFAQIVMADFVVKTRSQLFFRVVAHRKSI